MSRLVRKSFSVIFPLAVFLNEGRILERKTLLRSVEGFSGEGEPVYSTVKTGPNAFGLVVKGDSMFPLFLEGDIVIVDPAAHCDSGCVCVVRLNDDVSLKMFHETETEIILKPLNIDKHPAVIVTKGSKVDFKIIGKVVDFKGRF